MFQIGFWECVVVVIVAVFVLGPERLPAVARMAGRYYQRLKHLAYSVKHEFDLESQFQPKPKDPKDNP